MAGTAVLAGVAPQVGINRDRIVTIDGRPEFSPGSPLYPALVAPDSSLSLRVDGADDIEVLVRAAGRHLFVLAAKREGSTVEVRISGVPSTVRQGDVLFEAPRSVRVSDGSFTDWFGPNEVHVYRFDVSADRERLIDWFSRPV